MHAIERPHVSRVGLMALGAVVLAILVGLLAAYRVGEIGGGSTSGVSGAVTGQTVAVHGSGSAGSSWYANPFASPFHVAFPWARAARG